MSILLQKYMWACSYSYKGHITFQTNATIYGMFTMSWFSSKELTYNVSLILHKNSYKVGISIIIFTAEETETLDQTPRLARTEAGFRTRPGLLLGCLSYLVYIASNRSTTIYVIISLDCLECFIITILL